MMTTVTEELRLKLSHMERDIADISDRLDDMEAVQKALAETLNSVVRLLDSRLSALEGITKSGVIWFKGVVIGASIASILALGTYNIDVFIKILALL